MCNEDRGNGVLSSSMLYKVQHRTGSEGPWREAVRFGYLAQGGHAARYGHLVRSGPAVRFDYLVRGGHAVRFSHLVRGN